MIRTTSLVTVTVPFGWPAVSVTLPPIVLAPQANDGSPGTGGAGSSSVTVQVEVSRTWSAPPVNVAGPAPVRDQVPLLVSSAVVQLHVPENVVCAPTTPLIPLTTFVTASEPKARSTRLVTVTAATPPFVSTVTTWAAGLGPQAYESSTSPSEGNAPSVTVHDVPTGRLGVVSVRLTCRSKVWL